MQQLLSDIPKPPVAKSAGAFRREHVMRRLPPPPGRRTPAPPLAAAATTAPPFPFSASVSWFEGIGQSTPDRDSFYATRNFPADTTGAAGPRHYIQWVNTAFGIFEKDTGKLVYGPADGSILWKGFGGRCEATDDGDPIIRFDALANRWILTQFAIEKGPPFAQCIAVSATDDPLGKYHRYEYSFNDLNDYGKLGIWPDGYYATFNMFSMPSEQFLGTNLCVFERLAMLKGETARVLCDLRADAVGALPVDLDGTNPPPVGSPGYFVGLGANELLFWRMQPKWNGQAQISDPIAVPVKSFDFPCDLCIEQPNTVNKLSTVADRLMFRASYRNWPTHESLVLNHTVRGPGSRIGIKWYEIRSLASHPKVHQEGTFAPDSIARWIGSIASDKTGGIVLAYNVAASSQFPSIRATGRGPSDPTGALAIEKSVVEGAGVQNEMTRWGDYSTLSIDPADDCTFWFTAQYLGASERESWRTAIARIKRDACN
jgi:hypothetical protein